jgi:hypothetical protein
MRALDLGPAPMTPEEHVAEWMRQQWSAKATIDSDSIFRRDLRASLTAMVRRAIAEEREACVAAIRERATMYIGMLAVLMLVSGCVTMSPQAESVKVVYNPLELTAACTSLGEVKSWSGWGGFAAGAGYENAERGLREDTASLGGNTLLALYSRGGDLAGVSSRGQAYRCP